MTFATSIGMLTLIHTFKVRYLEYVLGMIIIIRDFGQYATVSSTKFNEQLKHIYGIRRHEKRQNMELHLSF